MGFDISADICNQHLRLEVIGTAFADDDGNVLAIAVPFTIVGAAPMLTTDNVGGFDDNVMPLSIRCQVKAAALMALFRSVSEADVKAFDIRRSNFHADGFNIEAVQAML